MAPVGQRVGAWPDQNTNKQNKLKTNHSGEKYIPSCEIAHWNNKEVIFLLLPLWSNYTTTVAGTR